MRAAVLALVPLPDFVLVDGVPHSGPADGAARRSSAATGGRTAIAAASIVAKVTRDRLMLELHAHDPRYGFDRHKGYATRDHLDAVARFGYSRVHRRSFRPPSLFDTIAALTSRRRLEHPHSLRHPPARRGVPDRSRACC